MADRDFVVLPRDALLELFGELALPPWTDTDGTTIGGSIDCAPIAQRITEWIAEHDLSDVHIGAPRVEPRFASVLGEAVAGSVTPTRDENGG